MDISITLRLSAAYYKEAYVETLKTRPSKQNHIVVSIVVIALGALLYIRTQPTEIVDHILPLLCIASGGTGIFIKYYAKKKWIDDRLNSKIFGHEVQIILTDESLKSKGPFTVGEMLWSGMNSIEHTEKGIILRPENGISLYLPKSAFQSQEQIDYVLSKAKT